MRAPTSHGMTMVTTPEPKRISGSPNMASSDADGEVAHHHQVAAAGQAVAVDLGDDRLRVVEQLEHPMGVVRQGRPPPGYVERAVLLLVLGLLLEVVAGAERASRSRDDQDPDGVVSGRARERAGEGLDQLVGEGVEPLGTVQGEPANRPQVLLQQDGFV